MYLQMETVSDMSTWTFTLFQDSFFPVLQNNYQFQKENNLGSLIVLISNALNSSLD